MIHLFCCDDANQHGVKIQECMVRCSHGLVKSYKSHPLSRVVCTIQMFVPVNSLNEVYGLRLKRFLYSLKGWKRSFRDNFMVSTAT